MEELPDEVSEQLRRRAFDIGVRISPDVGDEERREGHEQRVRRIKTVPADSGGDDERGSARGAVRAE